MSQYCLCGTADVSTDQQQLTIKRERELAQLVIESQSQRQKYKGQESPTEATGKPAGLRRINMAKSLCLIVMGRMSLSAAAEFQARSQSKENNKKNKGKYGGEKVLNKTSEIKTEIKRKMSNNKKKK